MNKLITVILISLIAVNSNATRPYYEGMSTANLVEESNYILLSELRSGSYNRKTDSYEGKLTVLHTLKGKKLESVELTHKHGWNRLQHLGGYYILYLNSSKNLIDTGSAIIPVINFGGPFSDSSLENAASQYELPEGSWFTYGNQLWGLKNCIEATLPTCEREMRLVEYTFNKSIQPNANASAD